MLALRPTEVHPFQKGSDMSIEIVRPSRLYETIRAIYYFIGIDVLQEGQLKRIQRTANAIHEISQILATLIFLFYLIVNMIIFARENNAVIYDYVMPSFNNAATFYFYRVQKNSYRKFLEVFECLDDFGSYLPSTKNFSNLKKQCARVIRYIIVYNILVIFVEPIYVLYIGYSKDEMAVMYWLNEFEGYQKVLCYVFGYFVISLRGMILKSNIGLFIVNYAMTCFLIKEACILQWRMLKKKDSFNLELLYQKLSETVQIIDNKLNFMAFLSFTILFTHIFTCVCEIFFGKNNSLQFGFVCISFLQGTAGFLIIAFFGSMVSEAGKNIQTKAMMLDPDVYIEHPETMLKYQKFELHVTLWNAIPLQRNLMGTIFEILISYVVVTGAVQNA
ncbi:uncharacterized protein NPIL_584991 [Nephila pilipes]|uniref:Uncharacterized protein n=1 Tax=Nephila pilipes TaxID=299642 RepID=A0A8X6UM51_NEPPI|nr:uncharacterized protein NPIL_584991 [Nephila pilipes]